MAAQLPYGREVSGQLKSITDTAEDTTGYLKVFFSDEDNPLDCDVLSFQSARQSLLKS
jgi:hypothetical protein